MREMQRNYVVTSTEDRGFIAYVMDSALPCSAFGDTEEEAKDNLSVCLNELVGEV
ncbi:type II toxin-antitoxin system HicB family antitoxin [Bacteroides sp. 3_1_13]|uniref:type II toxin-antitoxin system HicB family antitoxin n=1 Tax=Bacteroides sp. 3_1_13 TaxID=457389 RepID=UPI0006723443|nr:type II toxin-antitoxin system HicB family antitoxin [Bacteroides sp. 3_1_13]KMW80015.1 hypothetical protein HMPREF9009_00737 [Bacteroides sp. 3_1_13]